MMAKSVKKNYLYNVAYEIFVLVIPFVTTPYLSRVLGPAGNGTYSFIASIVSYFSLFAVLGVTTYGQREISFVQSNISERSVVFWNTKAFQCVTASIAIILYICYSLLQNNSALYLVFTFNLLAVVVDVSWFFRGVEEFGRIVIRNIAVKICGVIYIFAFVKKPQDLIIFAFGMCFFEFLANATMWAYLPKFIEKPIWQSIKPFTNFKIILSLFIPTIAIQIYTMLDKTMIGIITKDAFENGYYEQAIKVSRMAVTFVTALGTVMIPRIGFLFNSGEIEKVKNYIYRSYRFAWFLGVPLCFGLIGISDSFVPWFFGDGYDKVSSLLKVLSFLILAIGINNVTGMQYLIPTKRQNLFTRSVLLGAILNFTLNIIFIITLKSVGAAIASVFAEIAIAVIQLVYVRKEISPLKVVLMSRKYIFIGVIMFITIRVMSNYMPVGIFSTIALIFVGAIIYFGLLAVLGDQFLTDIIRTIKGKFRIGKKQI